MNSFFFSISIHPHIQHYYLPGTELWDGSICCSIILSLLDHESPRKELYERISSPTN